MRYGIKRLPSKLEKRINLVCYIDKLIAKCTDPCKRDRLQARLKSLVPKEKVNHGRPGKKAKPKVAHSLVKYPRRCEYCDVIMQNPHNIIGHMRHRHPDKCHGLKGEME